MWPWTRKVKVKVTSEGYNSVEVIKVYKPTKHQVWTVLVRDSLPLYPLFISAVCGLGSEIWFMKKRKIHDTARYRASEGPGGN